MTDEAALIARMQELGGAAVRPGLALSLFSSLPVFSPRPISSRVVVVVVERRAAVEIVPPDVPPPALSLAVHPTPRRLD